MSDEQKTTRKPRLDSVVKAIDEGAYDDDIKVLHDAIGRRRQALQQKALEFVREVFGSDYGVTRAMSMPETAAPDQAPEASNVFIERARRHAESIAEPQPTQTGPVEEIRAPQGGEPMTPEEEARYRAGQMEDLGEDFESRSPIIGPLPE